MACRIERYRQCKLVSGLRLEPRGGYPKQRYLNAKLIGLEDKTDDADALTSIITCNRIFRKPVVKEEIVVPGLMNPILWS